MPQNEKSNMVSKVLQWIVMVGLILLLFFLVFTRIDTYLKIKAVDDCARSSRFEKTISEEKTKVAYPVLDIYKNCIKDKGL